MASVATATEDDCRPRAWAGEADIGWALHLDAPCAPYAPVRIAYGPLEIYEETGIRGTLTLTLPHLPNARAEVMPWALLVTPPQVPATGFLWVLPAGPEPVGVFAPLGFPTDDGAQPELALFAPGATPPALDLPVGAARCGQDYAFGLLRDGWDAVRPVRLTLPACAAGIRVLRLPVAP